MDLIKLIKTLKNTKEKAQELKASLLASETTKIDENAKIQTIYIEFRRTADHGRQTACDGDSQHYARFVFLWKQMPAEGGDKPESEANGGRGG